MSKRRLDLYLSAKDTDCPLALYPKVGATDQALIADLSRQLLKLGALHKDSTEKLVAEDFTLIFSEATSKSLYEKDLNSENYYPEIEELAFQREEEANTWINPILEEEQVGSSTLSPEQIRRLTEEEEDDTIEKLMRINGYSS